MFYGEWRPQYAFAFRRISDNKMIATTDGLAGSAVACRDWGCVLGLGDWGKLLCFTSGRNERLHGTRYVFIAESDHLNVNFILFRFKCFVNRRDL